MLTLPQAATRRFLPTLLPLFLLLAFVLSGCSNRPYVKHTSPTVENAAPYGEMRSVEPINPPGMNANPAFSAYPGTKRVVKVALLLPLSGEAAPLGNAMLDAAMLGLLDKYNSMADSQKNVQVTLLPKDTGTKPKDAELAARSALQEGATLFLGPLFAESVKAVAPIAKSAGVPIITFSNNPDVALPGTYLYGFLPEQQVLRVADEAYKRRLDRIGALVPANAYGKMVASAMERAAAIHGRPLMGLEYYPEAGEADVAISRLLSAKNGAIQKPEYDAVLIAEGGDKLKAIAARLRRSGMTNSNTQFLGTGLWDDPALLADPNLAGGWFAGSSLTLSKGFDKRFQASYGYHAPRLASLAYDGVALAVTLAVSSPDKTFSNAALENPLGFSGPANGIFRFRGGLSQRGLSVLKLGPRGFEEISAAPRAFDNGR